MAKKEKGMEVFQLVKESIINPIESSENITKKFNTTQKTLILTLIMSAVMMVVHLITAMVSAVLVPKCDFWTGTCKTVVDFNQLGKVDYVNEIFRYFLLFTVFIAAIVVIYYVLALVFKKSIEFMDVLRLVLLALVPFIASTMIVGPLLGLIYSPLYLFILFAGSLYSFAIISINIEDKLKFKNKTNFIFYALSAITLIYVLQYYLF